MKNKIIGLFLITTFITANAYADLQKVGVVGAANKTLSAIDENKQNRNLALGQDIYFNDTLNTDASGKAQIMFVDKSALTIGPNAAVVIDKFVYNPADGGGELTMRGTKGAFRFIGGALSKKQEVKFKTPVGTIGIRGGIAIVEINPSSGATNATFLYGDKMSFQNLAGQKQETTNSGFAIAVATPTSMPTVPVAVDSAALAAKVTANFISGAGQNGGAAIVPTNKDIESKSVINDGKNLDSKSTGAGVDGDKKQGVGKDGQLNKDDGKNKPNDPATSGDKNKQGNNMAPAKNDGTRATADGGSVDKDGNYYTPAQTQAKMVANQQNSQGGAKDPGVLTADGGYVDSKGVQHSAAELATFRSDQANASGNTAGYNTAANKNYGGPVGPAPVATNTYGNYNAPLATGGYDVGANTYNNVGYIPPTAAIGYNTTTNNTPYVASNYIPTTNNYTNNYSVAQIDAKAANIYSVAYAAAIAAGGSTAQATAAGNEASNKFRVNLANGGEFNAAATAGAVAGQTYINTNIGGTTTTTTTTATSFANNLQNAQDTAANVNTGSKYTLDDIAVPVGSVTSTFAKQGSFDSRATLKASMDSNKSTNCSTCSFANWDVWAKVIPDGTSTTTSAIQAKLVPYVYGNVTQNIGTAVGTGTATYTGAVQGTTVNTTSGAVTDQQSSFKMDIDFSTRTISNLRAPGGGGMAFGGYTVTNTNPITVPTGAGVNASFSNQALTVTGGSGGATGSISGALFGGSAQNIGGNFKIEDNAANTKGAGVYIGAKP